MIAVLASAPLQGAPRGFSASRLQTGTFLYRETAGGKPDGESEIRVQKLGADGRYAFSNVVDGSSSQHWEAVVSPGFAPLSAELTYGEGGTAHKAFQLVYRGAKVTGFSEKKRAGGGPAYRRVADAISSDTVDQRIDWAAVMSLEKYAPGQQFYFHVYDPTGGNSRVAATVTDIQTMHVPAGDFRVARIAYRIDKATGAENFVVFVDVSPSRFLVKEIFPDGATSELLKIARDH